MPPSETEMLPELRIVPLAALASSAGALGSPVGSAMDRAGPGCLDSAPLDLSGFLPGYAERGALRFCRCVGRA
ncbi:hypothetical protein ABIF69_004320 [Bradyrhizobium japonicum]